MPLHDWSRVEMGIFHAFHHGWIGQLKRTLNLRALPNEYYALAEQHAGGFGPEVLTLKDGTRSGADEEPREDDDANLPTRSSEGGAALLSSPPKAAVKTEVVAEFYRRKQNASVVRSVSADRMVAVLEVVSPADKSTRNALRSFVEKSADLLNQRIHLLILDVQPPSPRDPQGAHGAIWEEISGQEHVAPADRPLTMAAYESGLTIRAYVQPASVGDVLPDMPLFLEPDGHVLVPLEETYQNAFAVFPRRWQAVLEGTA